AVYGSLDGEADFAAVAEHYDAGLRGPLSTPERQVVTRKSDKLPAAGEVNGSRQIIRITTMARGAGNREVPKVRPPVRIASNPALSTWELGGNVPPFNPQKLLAETGRANSPPGAADQPGIEPDAEVSFVTRDLTTVLPRIKIAAALALPLDEVLTKV